MSAVDAVTEDRQRRASDPAASAWVSANAGSGKTTVLARRVERLLLRGASPDRILCLTFTRAAAANMANRVLGELARWVTMEDGRLAEALGALEGKPAARVSAGERAQARRIFARALETPGGLRVQTIHAFCTAVLQQFPFEAGVAANFAVLDEPQTRELVAQARQSVIRAALAAPDEALGRALAAATARGGEAAFDETLREMLGHAAALRAPWGDDEALARRVRLEFGVAADTTAEAIEARVLSEARLPPERWGEAIAALTAGKPNDRKRALALATAAAAADTATRARAYEAWYRTKDGFLKPGSLCTKAIAEAHPGLAAALCDDLARLTELDRERRALRTAADTAALMILARAVDARVEAAKRGRGLLAQGDLVERACALIESDQAAWVRFKLDRGVDHVLIDEAQDTSAEQWRVVRALTGEFFAGEGAREGVTRTVFAVGDDKQSIFSFQGAEPRLFDAYRRAFRAAAEGALLRFETLPLTLSFRSGAAVLGAVEAVFDRAETAKGVTADEAFPRHQSARPRAPGVVELWPVAPRAERPEPDAWTLPFDAIDAEDPRVALAERVAGRIARMIRDGEAVHGLDGTPRPIRPGDVLVLVRQRGPFFDAMLRALKLADVPVAGADRLKLLEHIAVMDLVALGRAVLMPEDDLTLATVLKSPLLGLDDDDLFALAHGRPSSLAAALAAHAAPRTAAAAARFAAWRRRADWARPFEFYARVLGEDGGRAALLARLGREADEAIDEFLSRALAYERSHTPSLAGFLAWLETTEAEVKREMEQGRDEVRILTVHNAKGLEAPVVFLPDTTSRPGAHRARRIVPLELPGGWTLPAVSRSKGEDVALVEAARADLARAEDEEHRRLLYVALTRAADRLVIAGFPNGRDKEPNERSWYALVRDALAPQAVAEHDEEGEVVRWVWRNDEPGVAAAAGGPGEAADAALPPWVGRSPPAAPAVAAFAPSRAAAAGPAPRRRNRHAGDAAEAAARGDIMHRLLQALPDLPPSRRRDAALRFAARELPALAEEIAAEACALLEGPAFAPFFASGSAEVPVAGEVALPSGRVVRVDGRLDRLTVGDGVADVLDYKTGPRPARAPEAYVTQLALYREVVRAALPGRAVRCHLLWTAAPALETLDDAALDAALAALGGAGPLP